MTLYIYIHIYKYHCEASLFLPLPNVKVITASQTLVILDPAGGTCQWTALSWTEEKAWYTRFSISCNRLNLWSCKWLMWKMLFTLIYLTIWKFPGRCHIIEVIRNWPSACFSRLDALAKLGDLSVTLQFGAYFLWWNRCWQGPVLFFFTRLFWGSSCVFMRISPFFFEWHSLQCQLNGGSLWLVCEKGLGFNSKIFFHDVPCRHFALAWV